MAVSLNMLADLGIELNDRLDKLERMVDQFTEEQRLIQSRISAAGGGYQQTGIVVPATLVAGWNFEAGDNDADAGQELLTATEQGTGTTWGFDSGENLYYVQYDGNGYSTFSASEVLDDLDDFTISMRVKSASPGGTRGLISKVNRWAMYSNPAAEGILLFDWTSTPQTGDIGVWDGDWHTLIWSQQVSTGSATIVYLDGAEVLNTTLNVTTGIDRLAFATPNSASGGQLYTGQMAKVRIYDTIYTPATIPNY